MDKSSAASKEVMPREQLAMTQTPQAFSVEKLSKVHRAALQKGIKDSVASCTLMVDATNIKLTTPDDLEIFKALLALKMEE